MTPDEVGTVGIYCSAIIATIGFAAFAITARFWASRGGWHVFWYMLVIAWALDMAVIRDLFGDSTWFAWLRAVTFLFAVPFVLAWRSWIIFDLQLRHRLEAYRGHRQEEDAHE